MMPTRKPGKHQSWSFTNWLRLFDRKFHHQKRKVATTVDNCLAHPKDQGLKAIIVILLPPKTTSKTQPIDQSVIQNLRVYYRKLVILQQLKSYESTAEPTSPVSSMPNVYWTKPWPVSQWENRKQLLSTCEFRQREANWSLQWKQRMMIRMTTYPLQPW